MRSSRVISLVGAVAPLLVSVTGVAAPAGEPATASARLEVHALPDCTTREELAARVAARSRRIHFDDDAPGPTLRAIIAPGPRGGAVGELQITEPNGRGSTRRISAPSCAEATDAIALIIALTLDPTSAAATRVPAAAPPAPPPATAETPPAPSALARSAPTPAPAASRSTTAPAPEGAKPLARPSVAPPPDEANAVVVASPTSPVATTTRLGGGATAEVVTGPARDALLGLALYLVAALDRDALWSPAAFVRGTHAWVNGLVEPGGTAAFTLDAVTLDACVLRVHTSVFEARACASGLYGRLAATGSETYSPATASRPYAIAGGALALSAQIGRLLELSGRLGGGASLIRDSFAFSPTVFHRTAAATFSASLGIGIRFP